MRAPDLVDDRRSGGGALDLVFRLFVITAVFAIVGPPVGGLVAWLGMGLRSLQSPLPFVLGAYQEAALLAAVTGLLVAASGLIFGRTNWLVPIVAALVANLLFHALLLVGSGAAPIDGAALLRTAEVFLPPSFVAAVVCWLLTRRLIVR